MDCRKGRRARSLPDHRRAAEIGHQPLGSVAGGQIARPCGILPRVASTSPGRIASHLHPPVARIALHNPPLNVIDIPMMEQLAAAIAEAEACPDVTVIAFAGSDKVFSAGVDVAAHTSEHVQEMLTNFHAVFRAVVSARKVAVATVHGHCLGGGAELAMVCDIVVASESSTWGFPEISLGCFPPVAV